MGCDGIRFSTNMQATKKKKKEERRSPEQKELAPWTGPELGKNKDIFNRRWRNLSNFYYFASSKSPSMCFFGRKASEMKEREWKILSVPSSSCPDAGLRSTFPICALLLSRVESRREGAREQDREREREGVTVEWDSVSQSSQSGSQGRQQKAVYIELKAVVSKQAELPLPGLITRGCAPRCSNLPGSLGDPSPTGLFWEKTDRIVHWVKPLHTKSKCLWLAALRREGSEQDGVG